MAGEAARSLLANARKRRDELRREAEALDQFIAAYEQLLSETSTMDVSSEVQLDLYRGSTRRAAQARVAAMLDAARRIILAEGRPMRRSELVQRLEQQGYEIVGGDKTKVFGTNLWRSRKFRPVEGQGYWPVDAQLPGESAKRN